MNKRQFERVHFVQRVQVETEDAQSFETLCLDISMRGVLLVLPEDSVWSLEQKLTVHLILSETEQIVMQGCIAHIDGEVIGYAIDSMDLESMTTLRRLLQLNLGEQAVNREFSELIKDQLRKRSNDIQN